MPRPISVNPLQRDLLHLAHRTAVILRDPTLVDLADDEWRRRSTRDTVRKYNLATIEYCLGTRTYFRTDRE